LALGWTSDVDKRIFVYDLTTGTLLHTLAAPIGAVATFGETVNIKGNYLVAGNRNWDFGPAAVYDLTTGTLLQTFTETDATDISTWLNPGIGGSFGSAVAITDSKTIIGSRSGSEDSTGHSGAFLIYSNPGQEVQESTGPADWSNATLAYTLDNPSPFGSSGNDKFGTDVAISGNYAIVGADREDDAGGGDSGKAYIYNASTGALLYTLDNPNPYGGSPFDYFGASVAISGDHAIISAYDEDDASGTSSGKAYIYNVTTGTLVHTLDNPNAYSTGKDDNFGRHVGISGDRAIVGAILEGNKAGKAYIYNVSTGALVHTLHNPLPTANNSTDGDQFGTVAISGDHAIVGAYNADDADGTYSGKAYIYNVSTGALVHTLDNPNPFGTSAGDKFGFSVSISGDHAIVGAAEEDDAGGISSGKAYIYNVSTGALVHTLDNPNPFGTSEYDRFGWAVAISGDHAIVCAWLEDEADGVTNSGKVYIYNVTSGALVKTLDNSNAYGTGKDDYFGYSVAISGSNIIVGAINEDDADGTNSGKAYIFSAIASAPAEESTGWTIDLSNVTYDSVSFGVNQDNDPMSIAFNNDGTKMYMMGSFHKNIHQYTLSTGFDLSTASADNVSFYVGSQDNSPMRLKFNTDGTKMYINGLQRNKVHQYSLGSGFDLSTASYDNVAFEIPEWNYGFTFNNDGTKMYSSSNALRQYSLSAGFDISTATYDNVNFDLSSQSHSAVDTYFNSDGTKMYILFAGGEDDVHQYTLTTGFDISTASYDNVMFSVGSEETNPTAICISSDGTKMYSVGASNDTVYQYSTGL